MRARPIQRKLLEAAPRTSRSYPELERRARIWRRGHREAQAARHARGEGICAKILSGNASACAKSCQEQDTFEQLTLILARRRSPARIRYAILAQSP